MFSSFFDFVCSSVESTADPRVSSSGGIPSTKDWHEDPCGCPSWVLFSSDGATVPPTRTTRSYFVPPSPAALCMTRTNLIAEDWRLTYAAALCSESTENTTRMLQNATECYETILPYNAAEIATAKPAVMRRRGSTGPSRPWRDRGEQTQLARDTALGAGSGCPVDAQWTYRGCSVDVYSVRVLVPSRVSQASPFG